MLTVGDVDLQRIQVGDTPVSRIYQGDEMVWASTSVVFTVEGTTFSPILELADGSTTVVEWYDESGSQVATGLTPTITWGAGGAHSVYLSTEFPEEIVTVNLGFHNEQDNGLYSLPSTYNYQTQPVTSITNLQYLSGLQRFMAASTDGISQDGSSYTGPRLGGHLDFSGMSTIEYIECFRSNVATCDLTGCSSLIRLVMEQTNVTTLDLNPVRGTLRDFRGAFQNGGALTLTPLAGPLPDLYHYCVRRQAITGLPDVETLLPAVRQLWIWRCSLNVDEIVVRSSQPLHSVLLSSSGGGGIENIIRHLDLAGQTWGPLSGAGTEELHAFGVGMQTINLTGMGEVQVLHLYNNLLDEAAVDHVLAVVNAWGTNSGQLRLEGNAPPSSTGLAAVDALRSRGWSVSHTTVAVAVWADEFDRPDATGFANSGGWAPQAEETDTNVAIVNEQLVLSGTTSYRRFYHAAGGVLPADLEVVLGFTIATASEPGIWWGVASHVSMTGTSGRRVLFRADENILRIGSTANSTDQADINVSAQLPATWKTPGQHTLTLRTVGTTSTVLADGVPIATRSGFGLNAGVSGLGVGIVGQPLNRAWDFIRVYAL